MAHIPVLLKEVIEYLNPQSNQNFIDCTINGGGHSLEILKRIKPNGKILGIDWDKEVLDSFRNKIKEEDRKNFILLSDNYANLQNIIAENNFSPVQGILMDVGFSSFHPDESNRGFTFLKNETLDMRYSMDNPLTAKEIINKWPEEELVRIFKEYGEERWAKKIAYQVIFVRQRKLIETTNQLVEIIQRAIPFRFHHAKIHFATRVFQALRIAVNNELENLSQGLESAALILEKGGRIAVISFHSLEDRIVKNFFRDYSREGKFKILTKKPIRPSEQEIQFNPRARSAKLRVAEKI